MIVSITFRHDSENRSFRHRIKSESMMLLKIMPSISRVDVNFYFESHHNNYSDLVTCHISINAPYKQHIDIYEHQSCESIAFDQALERARARLSRMKFCKSNYPIHDFLYLHERLW